MRFSSSLAPLALSAGLFFACSSEPTSAPASASAAASEVPDPFRSVHPPATNLTAKPEVKPDTFVVDPTVEPELQNVLACYLQLYDKEVSSCDAAEDAFYAFASKHWEAPDGDQSASTNRQRVLVESLLALLEHKDKKARLLAAFTLSRVNGALGLPEHVKKDPRALALLRRRLTTETESSVAGHVVWLLSVFGATDDDRRSMLAWVKARPDGEERDKAIESALGPLTPPQGTPPLDEAVDLALARLASDKDGPGRTKALDILRRATARAEKDVCAALKKNVEAFDKAQFWIEAMEAAASLGEPCKSAVEAGADRLVTTLKKNDVVRTALVDQMLAQTSLPEGVRKKLQGAMPAK